MTPKRTRAMRESEAWRLIAMEIDKRGDSCGYGLCAELGWGEAPFDRDALEGDMRFRLREHLNGHETLEEADGRADYIDAGDHKEAMAGRVTFCLLLAAQCEAEERARHA